jgi:hypothetical protein
LFDSKVPTHFKLKSTRLFAAVVPAVGRHANAWFSRKAVEFVDSTVPEKFRCWDSVVPEMGNLNRCWPPMKDLPVRHIRTIISAVSQ